MTAPSPLVQQPHPTQYPSAASRIQVGMLGVFSSSIILASVPPPGSILISGAIAAGVISYAFPFGEGATSEERRTSALALGIISAGASLALLSPPASIALGAIALFGTLICLFPPESNWHEREYSWIPIRPQRILPESFFYSRSIAPIPREPAGIRPRDPGLMPLQNRNHPQTVTETLSKRVPTPLPTVRREESPQRRGPQSVEQTLAEPRARRHRVGERA